jgi:OmpA-OmpF porin, OOP family
MNKPSKFALAIAFAAVTATGAASAQSNDNWVNSYGNVWKNSYGQCWQDSFWTPATADPQCVDKKDSPVSDKVVFSADTFFDFNKSNLKPEGRQLLDQVAAQLNTIKLETVIAVGYTDSIGSVDYNLGLGQRRADAVKAYLVSKGVAADRIYTESKGKADPIASNATAEGRAKNRRVEVEIVGSRS